MMPPTSCRPLLLAALLALSIASCSSTDEGVMRSSMDEGTMLSANHRQLYHNGTWEQWLAESRQHVPLDFSPDYILRENCMPPNGYTRVGECLRDGHTAAHLGRYAHALARCCAVA